MLALLVERKICHKIVEFLVIADAITHIRRYWHGVIGILRVLPTLQYSDIRIYRLYAVWSISVGRLDNNKSIKKKYCSSSLLLSCYITVNWWYSTRENTRAMKPKKAIFRSLIKTSGKNDMVMMLEVKKKIIGLDFVMSYPVPICCACFHCQDPSLESLLQLVMVLTVNVNRFGEMK